MGETGFLPEEALRGAFVQTVTLDEEHHTLLLELTLPTSRGTTGEEAWLHVPQLSDIARVRRFFFGRRLKAVSGHVDQVVDYRVTRTGCSIELRRAGRIAIRSSGVPVAGTGEAGEQALGADETRRVL
jgi:hypothetical protein